MRLDLEGLAAASREALMAEWREVVRPAFKPGSRFVREYHGVTHVVEVRDNGRFVWNEQSFKFSPTQHAP